MSRTEYSLTLRLRHPDCDPAVITQRLGVEPQHAWRAGDPRPTESGRGGVYRETFWLGMLPSPLEALRAPFGEPLPHETGRDRAATKHLAEQLVGPQTTLFFVLLRMKREAEFWHAFARANGTIECHLQVHDAPRFHLALSPDLLRMFVDFGIAFSIEVDSDLAVAA
jgi:hypothetical protein